MHKRTITNLVLGIALAALAIFIYTEIQREANPDLTRLTDLKIEDVTRVEINNVRNQSIVLEKLNDDWRLTQPFTARANTTRIEKLLDIVRAPSQAQYNSGEVDLAQLHLINPDITLRINDMELIIGATESLEQRRYIKTGDQIHLISDNYSFLAQGAATDFVDTQLLPGNSELTMISLPELTVRQTDNGWQLEGQTDTTDTDSLQALVDQWRQAKALKVSRENPNGLAPDVSLQLADHSTPLTYHWRAGDNVLIRLDTGLGYHLHASNADNLFRLGTLQTPADEPAATDTSPSDSSPQ